MTWFTSVWEEVFTERLSQSVRSHPDDVRNAFVSHPFFSFIFDCLSRIGLLQVEYSSKNTPQYIQFAILRKTRLGKGVYLPGVCVRSSVHIPPTFAMLSRCTSSFALPLDGLLRISHFLFLEFHFRWHSILILPSVLVFTPRFLGGNLHLQVSLGSVCCFCSQIWVMCLHNWERSITFVVLDTLKGLRVYNLLYMHGSFYAFIVNT